MAGIDIKLNRQVNVAGRRAHPEHRRLMAEATEQPRVRVEPTSEAYRRVLRHPNGMAFRDEGSVEWPLDRFTQRRVAEGSVKIVEHIALRRGSDVPKPEGQG